MLDAIDRCPKPVVARVNGHALGGGAGLVACADIAVAHEGAQFGFPEARLGVIPATISPYVLRAIGPGARARPVYQRPPVGRRRGPAHRAGAPGGRPRPSWTRR